MIKGNIRKGKLSKAFPFFVVLLFACVLSSKGVAQVHEIGLGVGGMNYVGELARSYKLENHRPAGLLFYRYNLNNIVSFRGGLSLGKVVGSDDKPYDSFGARRQQEFNTVISEFAATFEYNFLDYKSDKALIRWSPYFFGGLAVFRISSRSNQEKATDYSRIQPSVPVGIGFKYRASPYFTLGFEWGARKTFFDYIDNVGEYLPAANGTVKNYQYGNINQKDWYFFTGISLSYTFWTIPCPYKFEKVL